MSAVLFQQALYGITQCMVAVLIITEAICAGDNNLFVAQFLSTSVFLVGVATLLQTTLGMRYVRNSNVTSTQEASYVAADSEW